MELYKIALRAIFAYIILLGMIRVSGKRTVAEGTNFDFIVALILGDMVDDIFWAEVPASQFIVAIGALVLAHTSATISSYYIPTFSRLVDGSSELLIRDGQVNRRGLRRERVSKRELASMLRTRGLNPEDIACVKSLCLQEDGSAPIIKREWAKAADKRDLDKLRKSGR